MRRKVWMIMGALGIAALAGWSQPVRADDPSGVAAAAAKAANENPAIVRWSSGKFIYRVIEDQRQRGFEEWRMTVHADGSRTLTTWYSVFEDHLETSSVLRVNKNFRPLSLYKTTWVDDQLTSTHAIVTGDTITTTIQVNDDITNGTSTVPERFTMMIGPIAADALHFGMYDKSKGGVQTSNILASVSAGGLCGSRIVQQCRTRAGESD